MRNILVKKEHLIEYVENKKAEKQFYKIVEHLHLNTKMLNEAVSHKQANQSVIDDYHKKNQISSKVFEMLVKNKIINENYEII